MHAITFMPRHGIEHVQTPPGDTISIISQSSWPETVKSLEEISQRRAPTSPGNPLSGSHYVLLPELITTCDEKWSNVRSDNPIIEERVAQVTELTNWLPETTVLLGSVAFTQTLERPGNALLFLRNGKEVGRTYKRWPVNQQEQAFFADTSDSHYQCKPAANIFGIICSDIVNPPSIDAEVDTVLVSACWGVPHHPSREYQARSEAMQPALGEFAGDIFTRNANVSTVVMADRVPHNSASPTPYNFVARRIS